MSTVVEMRLTFFGVRGSCPCAGDEYRRVGGNTSCTLVSVAGEPPLALDLGTGLRALGEALRRNRTTPLRVNSLLTHLHFDHILGLPFFAPLREPGAQLNVYGPAQEEGHLRDVLASAVRPPFFPVKMAGFGGDIDVVELGDESVEIGAFTVHACQVSHPGSTLGFRVEAEGRSLVYLPDHQAPRERDVVPDAVLELCEGADVLVHDAQYSEEEFAAKPDWGHSTPEFALLVAAQAGARMLYLFHHDPSHTDEDIGAMVQEARRLPEAKRLDEVRIAAEGMTVAV